jgi:hypothetical protein
MTTPSGGLTDRSVVCDDFVTMSGATTVITDDGAMDLGWQRAAVTE